MDTTAYLTAFVSEANELIQRLNDALLQLEKEPGDKKQIEELFRAVHSLKGMSAAMGYERITDLTHKMENSLDKMRRGEKGVTSSFINLMFKCFDVLQRLLDDIVESKQSNIDLAPIFEGLARDDDFEVERSEKVIQLGEKRAGSKVLDTQTVRVATSHLDHLVDLAGELVIGRARLEQFILPLDMPELRSALDDLKAVITELQQEIMQTRMVPVGNIFHRFYRMVRDTAKDLGKKVNFAIEGGQIELDKTILDEITDPIVHLLRNAIGHGIETPEERKKRRKKPQGEVKLIARREKDRVLIEVADDGKGIDIEDLRKCMIKQGFLPAKKVKALTDEEILYFLVQPGVTMEEKTTALSGRGVGLDAVRGKVEQLGGNLEIKSEPGKGSTFTLKLPLTLAIIQALLVKIGQQVLAVPLNNVVEVVSLREQKVETVQGREVALIHSVVVPLFKLREAFDIGARNQNPLEESYAVVVEVGNRKIGLVIDSLVDQREIVIKPLSSLLKGLKGIGGATILGDGRVALILDVRSLFKGEKEKAPSATRLNSPKSGEPAPPKVMLEEGGKNGERKTEEKSFKQT